MHAINESASLTLRFSQGDFSDDRCSQLLQAVSTEKNGSPTCFQQS
jgi:hypothetical protein